MSFDRKKVLLCLLVPLLLYALFAWTPLAGYKKLKQSHYSLEVQDSQGRELRILPLEDGLRRIYIPLDDLSPDQIKLILDSEDKRYYGHPGVDPAALVRALYLNLSQGGIESGASTITMQLTRMMAPHPPGYLQKIQEMMNALRLDARMGKKQILEHYLNHLPFGHNLEGLETAARFYMGKQASSLSPEELLILMMIPRSPSLYDPLTQSEENLEACLRTIPRLNIRVDETVLKERLSTLEGGHPWTHEAPHFVSWVESQVSEDALQRGGSYQTSLDLDMQHLLEKAIAYNVTGAGDMRISNGAGLLVDNKSGAILAYSGSVDFFNQQNSGQIDGVHIKRQPGSTLKPFLYGLALEMGFTPSTILPDIPMEFGGARIYIPENYNERFNGPVRFSVSLASSLNVPAVYLLERVGVDSLVSLLLELGMDSLDSQYGRYGVGLALGNAEISLYELVQAYRVFSTEGLYSPLQYRIPLRDSVSQERVYSPEAAQLIRDILSDPLNRVLGFGFNSALNRDYDAFFKTGTSSQFNNIWAVGGTESFTCGIWMGNFSGNTVIGAPGSSIPAQALIDILDELDPESRFKDFAELEEADICSLSGELAGENCPHIITQKFIAGTLPDLCSWHSLETVQYPAEFGRWLEESGIHSSIAEDSQASYIRSPVHQSIYYLDPTLPPQSQSLKIELEGFGPGNLYLDGNPVFQGELPHRLFIPLQKGLHRLELESPRGNDSILFEVK